MRIFVAGAAGAIGRHLVPMLIESGHEVVGTTRKPDRLVWLREHGAKGVQLDAFDVYAVRAAIEDAHPEVVINQLTDLAGGFGPAELAATTRLRQVGTRNLVEAARAAGARRLVAESGAWIYAPGEMPYAEDDPPEEWQVGLIELESLTLETPGIDGIVLRYGYFYGPGTSRPNPTDVTHGPRVHVADAARAALLAAERGQPGIYNIVDDDEQATIDRARDILGWTPSAPAALPAAE